VTLKSKNWCSQEKNVYPTGTKLTTINYETWTLLKTDKDIEAEYRMEDAGSSTRTVGELQSNYMTSHSRLLFSS
jgi:hypothetical protein